MQYNYVIGSTASQPIVNIENVQEELTQVNSSYTSCEPGSTSCVMEKPATASIDLAQTPLVQLTKMPVVDLNQIPVVDLTGTPSLDLTRARKVDRTNKTSLDQTEKTSHDLTCNTSLEQTGNTNFDPTWNTSSDQTGNTRLNQTGTESVGKMLFCLQCEYKTTNEIRFKKHLILHKGKIYHCNMCQKSYMEESKLQKHILVKHEKSIHFRCELCANREFTSKGGLKYHFKTMHQKDFDYWCDRCCKGFNQLTFYKSHMRKHEEGGRYKCTFCSKEFSYLATLTMHRKMCMDLAPQTEIDHLTCEMCGETFTTTKDLDEHVSTEHCDVTRFRCHCGSEFLWKTSFNTHKEQCTASTDVTDKNTTNTLSPVNKATVSDHEMKNSKELKQLEQSSSTKGSPHSSIQVTNLESGEQFVYSMSGKNGSLETKEEQIHSCQHCNYKTSKAFLLKRHQLVHKGKRNKTRDYPKYFSSKNKMQSYSIVKHRGRPNYKCENCGRIFASKGGISYHQRTKHSNVFRYKCETCDKGFNSLQRFLGHKKTHKAARSFVCERCDVGFASPSVFTSHQLVCNGKVAGLNMNGQLDLYPCKLCPQKFAMLQSLKDHCLEIHGTVVEEGGGKEDGTKTMYICICGMEFELRALYDFHKTMCKLSDKTCEIILQTGSQTDEVAGDAEMEKEGFKQLSPEKFNTIVNSQPVFPS